MAGRRHQFRGQFGINETPLTIAIESGNYDLAEEIILSTSDLSYLNDGPYQNVPLHMVLTNNYNSCLKRNLKLAKLLVEKGANPNLRVPFGDLDRTSPSPFEELVICHEILKYFVKGKSDILCDELEMYLSEEEILVIFVNNTVDFDGKWCIPDMCDCERLIKQTSELIDIFLEHGGDPNVITTFGYKTLFHWVVEHDLELAKRFLKTSRVNINLCDAHGNSPLMDSILRNDAKDSLCLYETLCELVDPVDLNSRNCVGETALFRASFVGAVEVASKLCEHGAKIDCATCVSNVAILYPNECVHCVCFTQYPICYLPSPVLAPLLSDSPSRLRYTHVASYESDYSVSAPHKHLIDKLILSSISPLIDQDLLKCQSVSADTSSMTSLLEHSNFNHLKDGRIPSADLTNLMFGQLSAGLRQLCIRSIFDHVLMVSPIPKKKWPDLVPQNLCIKDCKGALMESHIAELVEMLGLPQSFKIFFEIEAAKYQMCKIVMSLQCLECQLACSESDISMYDDDEEESTDSSDVSSDYGASVLFSSDILSEESSSEVDDLSDADFSDSEDDKEVGEASRGSGDVPVRRKVRCEYESLTSSSDNICVIVETLCEDVAENMAQQHHKSECHEKYQRFGEERTDSPISRDCTSPSSSSDNAFNISRKESVLDSS